MNRLITLPITLTIALAVQGCKFQDTPEDKAFEAAHNAITKDFLDPSSAQFRNDKMYKNCVEGEVNGKNSFGAYIGFKKYMYSPVINAAAMEPDLSQFSPDASILELKSFSSTTDAYTKVLESCLKGI